MDQHKPIVTIIIPCRTLDEASDCYLECSRQAYQDIQVIILPDEINNIFRGQALDIIATGKILPSHKRDIGIKHAKGEIIAFIDADAYPSYLWLYRAVQVLKAMPNLAGICGPGILPPDATLKERAVDFILKRLPFAYRVTPMDTRYVKDYPTFNLIIWKKYIDQVHGFSCDYLTGEDTLLCKKITKQTGKEIIYSPKVVVYHSRRTLFRPFLKQIAVYGEHRGFFFKRHPETSRKLVFILPSIGVLCLLFYSLWVLFLR